MPPKLLVCQSPSTQEVRKTIGCESRSKLGGKRVDPECFKESKGRLAGSCDNVAVPENKTSILLGSLGKKSIPLVLIDFL